jgi:putative thiamine transport system ATP-binding protein
VLLDGRDVTHLAPEERRIGLLFQDPLLFPHLSVASNLMFGIARDAPDRRGRIREALTAAGLDGFGARDPGTLSGGQKARIALLRVLLSEPKALLLDEPFSKLDNVLRTEIRAFVFERVRVAGLPTLLVTHDPGDAAAAGGAVVQIGA